jgi:Tol biopolymer transport system component
MKDGGGPASKAPADGGDSVDMPTPFSEIVPRGFSPDGKLFAYTPPEDRARGKKNLGIASSESGQLIKIIELPRSAYPRKMQWTPDGKGITYIDNRGGADNLWTQSLDGAAPIQLTNFKEYRIHCFAWSGDGKHMVFNRGFQTSDIVLINSVD